MKFKSEDGFTGIDITVAILVITIFITLIGSLMFLVDSNTKESARKADAINYAVAEIENIKSQARSNGISSITGLNDSTDNDGEYILDSSGNRTPYYKVIKIVDYKDLTPANQANSSIKSNVVKKITVKISYRSGGQDENIELSAIVVNEEEI